MYLSWDMAGYKILVLGVCDLWPLTCYHGNHGDTSLYSGAPLYQIWTRFVLWFWSYKRHKIGRDTHTHVHGQNDRQTQKITIKCPFTKISDPVHKMLGHNIGPLNGSHLPSNFCVQCPSSVGDMGVLMQKKWQSDHNISSPHNICGWWDNK